MLEIPTVSREIDGEEYYVRPMPPPLALRLLGDLQAVVTGAMKGAAGVSGPGQEVDVSLGELIAGIGGGLNGAALLAFKDRILVREYVSVKIRTIHGDEVVPLDVNRQEELFTGKILSLLKVMYFILEVNYKDFFTPLQEVFGAVSLPGLSRRSRES